MTRFRMIAAAVVLMTCALHAQPVALDGSIGAEWAGVTAKSVLFNSAAPVGNFGTPTNENHLTAYDVFMRRDNNWLYTAVRSSGLADPSAAFFSNLYFSTRFGPGPVGNDGASIGIEVNNDQAFRPGFGGYYGDVGAGTGGLIRYVTSNVNSVGIIEAAFDLSIFTANALNVTGYTVPSNPIGIRLNLSQSFGYSVAGGNTSYGDERLGFVTLPQTAVPEPSTYALMAAGLMGLVAVQRRRRRAA